LNKRMIAELWKYLLVIPSDLSKLAEDHGCKPVGECPNTKIF
jgi:hypothetical protein